MGDAWSRGLLGVAVLLLFALLIRGGEADAVSAPVADGEYHLVTMSDDSILLVRRTGDRLEGLGQLRQGKDKRRYLWTEGSTFDSGRSSNNP